MIFTSNRYHIENPSDMNFFDTKARLSKKAQDYSIWTENKTIL